MHRRGNSAQVGAIGLAPGLLQIVARGAERQQPSHEDGDATARLRQQRGKAAALTASAIAETQQDGNRQTAKTKMHQPGGEHADARDQPLGAVAIGLQIPDAVDRPPQRIGKQPKRNQDDDRGAPAALQPFQGFGRSLGLAALPDRVERDPGDREIDQRPPGIARAHDRHRPGEILRVHGLKALAAGMALRSIG